MNPLDCLLLSVVCCQWVGFQVKLGGQPLQCTLSNDKMINSAITMTVKFKVGKDK